MALFFPDFFDKPQNMRFCDQDSDEQIELLLRQDWIVNIPWIFISTILLFIPAIFFNLISKFNISLISQVPSNLITSALILWYLAVFAYIVQSFLYWYFNIYIVTNKHLVDFDFISLLNRNITELRLDDVQGSSYENRGLIRSIFNFGDVKVETAAETEAVLFKDVPSPDVVHDRIEQLQDIAEPKERGL